ncbi:MAG: glycosyltransferase [Proteobacteria bacterium]|nr:glycosyltransferase [Pseudomonadota bacterium]
MGIQQRPLRLWVVSNNYPTTHRPHIGTFVEGLVAEWVRMGAQVAVVAPHPYWSPQTRQWVFGYPDSDTAEEPRVLRPGYPSLSNLRLGPVSTRRMGLHPFTWVVRRATRRIGFEPDAVYGHFLLPSGYAALELGRALGVPAVVALGESHFSDYEREVGFEFCRRTVRRFQGIVSVSRRNRDYAVEVYGVPEERILVAPNAVDPGRFCAGDRAALRRGLGLAEDRSLVVFVGHFEERKGPLRVVDALGDLPDTDLAFVGEGPQDPRGSSIVFSGPVPHTEVSRWLGAADLFVLPTLDEGSPNAILEAMACGVPVVSSDIPSLREIADDDCALLVDPRDRDALRNAVVSLLRDADRRSAMGRAALARSAGHTLEDRARRILEWLTELSAR